MWVVGLVTGGLSFILCHSGGNVWFWISLYTVQPLWLAGWLPLQRTHLTCSDRSVRGQCLVLCSPAHLTHLGLMETVGLSIPVSLAFTTLRYIALWAWRFEVHPGVD